MMAGFFFCAFSVSLSILAGRFLFGINNLFKDGTNALKLKVFIKIFFFAVSFIFIKHMLCRENISMDAVI